MFSCCALTQHQFPEVDLLNVGCLTPKPSLVSVAHANRATREQNVTSRPATGGHAGNAQVFKEEAACPSFEHNSVNLYKIITRFGELMRSLQGKHQGEKLSYF